MTGSSCHGQGQKSLFHVKFLKVPKVLSMKVQLQLLVWNSTRRSLKVQSRSVNETIGQMMLLYNKLKASVTSGSLVCGELFYASESPLEPERRLLYVSTIILAVRIRNFTHDFCDWTAEKKPRLNRIVL